MYLKEIFPSSETRSSSTTLRFCRNQVGEVLLESSGRVLHSPFGSITCSFCQVQEREWGWRRETCRQRNALVRDVPRLVSRLTEIRWNPLVLSSTCIPLEPKERVLTRFTKESSDDFFEFSNSCGQNFQSAQANVLESTRGVYGS